MSDTRICPQCGAKRPQGAVGSLCPACLMRLGFEQGEAVSNDRPSGSLPKFQPPTPHELAPCFPQFEILDLLGYGGMGAVYKARQKSLDRLVALKIIKPDAASDAGFANRFAREARALAKLNHSNIVAVHDFGQTTGPAGEVLYFFVMEFVDGTNLRKMIETKAISADQALAVIPQICEALQFAHNEGIVHRDIKPENILVDSRGRVKIADFGLAKLLGASPANDLLLTGTHQVMGTPRYMAPEQMEGSRAVDHRADIYSLGVVFYEMLTGELPMGSFEPPSRKVHVDVRLDEIVLRSLAKEPERRYQHASEVKSDVESVSQLRRAQGAGYAGTLPHVPPVTGKKQPLPPIGGRDWVTLKRQHVEQDLLPNLCMVCGEPTFERVNKTFQYTPDWPALLLFVGGIPGIIALALTTKEMRISCPMCPNHRGHWKWFPWVAGAGWLVAIPPAVFGFAVGYFLDPDGVGLRVAGAIIGGAGGIAGWVIPMIYLGTTRIGAKLITKDEIRLHGVSGAFANAVRDQFGDSGDSSVPISGEAAIGKALVDSWNAWWGARMVPIVLLLVLGVSLLLFITYYASGRRVSPPPVPVAKELLPVQPAAAAAMVPESGPARSTAIHEACRAGNVSRVKELLDQGAGVNDKDAAGGTLLMASIAGGHRSLALTLVVLGADLTEQDGDGWSALRYAVEARDKQFLSRLSQLTQIASQVDADRRQEELRVFSGIERSLLEGRAVDVRGIPTLHELELIADETGEIPAHAAARIGDWDLYTQTASSTDSCRVQDKQGRTIAMHAAIHGHVDWFERLKRPAYFGKVDTPSVFVGEMLPFDLDQLAVKDKFGRTAMDHARSNGHTEIEKILREHVQAVIDDQTAKIAEGGDEVARHTRLLELAKEALGKQAESPVE